MAYIFKTDFECSEKTIKHLLKSVNEKQLFRLITNGLLSEMLYREITENVHMSIGHRNNLISLDIREIITNKIISHDYFRATMLTDHLKSLLIQHDVLKSDELSYFGEKIIH